MTLRSILLAEDDPVQRQTVRRILENELAVNVVEAPDGAAAIELIKNKIGDPFVLMLVDLQMPVIDGMALLKQMRTLLPQLPCIVLTGSEKIEDVVEAMRHGALDFITKPAQRERLVTSVRNALSMRNLQQEVSRLQRDHSPHYGFDEVLAVSPGLRPLVTLGRKAAGSDIPVLITGESGVGKEVFAGAIYKESKRSGCAFVTVNCGALPDNLVESALFGHEKGAFTGAVARSVGKCRDADGGVLFLDEIGELKPETQVKFLRLLQQGEVEPVGSSKSVKVNIRVISATNQPLEDLVAKGTFREDLYYRLQGLPLHLPPLRERREDIPLLAAHLLKRIALAENHLNLRLSPEALAWLTQYQWPGNVRELQHLLHRASLLAETGTIQPEDVSRLAQPGKNAARIRPGDTVPRSSAFIDLDGTNGQPKPLDQIEREVIEATLARHDSHIGKTAAALGIGQSTLYKRLNKPAA